VNKMFYTQYDAKIQHYYKDCKQVYLPQSLFTMIRAGFKVERPGLSPRGLDKTGIESRDFTDTFASQE
jgi:hypothetical protein